MVGTSLEFQPAARLDLLAWHSVELAPGAGGPFAFTFRVRDGLWSAPADLAPERVVRALAVAEGRRPLALLATLPAPGARLSVVELLDDGTLGPPRTVLADPVAEGAAIAAGASEDVVAFAARAAAGGFEVRAARRGAGATQFSSPVALSAPLANATLPRVVPLASGTLVVWHDAATADVHAARATAGGPWSDAQRLDSPGADAGPASVAADAGGALVVWRQAGGTQIAALRVGPEGELGAPEILEESHACCLSDPLVAVGGGQGLVLWQAEGLWWVHGTALAERDDAPAAVGGGACAGPPQGAALALAADGTAVAAWICDGAPWVAVRPPGQPFGAETPLAPPSGAANVALTVDAGGRALVAWDELLAAGGRALRTARFDGASWSAPVTAVEAGGDCAVAPRIAVLADGRALLAWTRTVGCDFAHGFGAGVARFE